MNQFGINKPEHLQNPEVWAAYLQECKERNEQARRQRQEAQEAERKAQQAKRQAERDKEAEAEIASFKATARLTFPGTEAQFESAWPQLLRSWQIEQALTKQNSIIERKRTELADWL